MAGQSNADFKGSSDRLRILYRGHSNSSSKLTEDAYTNTNPPIAALAGVASSTLTGITKTGVLGSSVAVTRPDAGGGYIGGPPSNEALEGNFRPLGLFRRDANGLPNENDPGVASEKTAYLHGGGQYGCQLYESKILNTGAALSPSWTSGVLVYCSRNGLITTLDNANNTLERVAAHSMSPATGTVMGVVLMGPTSAIAEVTLDLHV